MKKILSIYYIFFLPLFLIIMLISPFILIRFGKIASDRIGHLSSTIELYLCELDNKVNTPKIFFFDVFATEKIISNSQFVKFWKKKIIIFPYVLVDPFIFFCKIIPYSSKHNIFKKKNYIDERNLFSHRDTKNLIDISPKHISFEKNEVDYCEKILKLLNIEINSKLALLNLRDNYYFEKYHPKKKFKEWNIKNCEIETYKRTINYLIKNDYNVIRIGKGSSSSINLNNNKFIDLTNHKYRSDLLETFLINKCNIFIGSNSGGTYPSIFNFRKPTFVTNFIPAAWLPSYSEKIFVCLKRVINRKNNKILTLSELKNLNIIDYQLSQRYQDLDLKVEDILSEELVLYSDEFVKKVENKWKYTEEENLLKKEFNDHFIKLTKEFNLHGKIKCDIGYNFLKNNKDWILK